MTDTNQPVEEPSAVQDEPGQGRTAERTVSRRGRRLMIAIIIILLLGLCGVSALLVSLVAPRSGVASSEDAGEVEWVKSIYGWGSTPNTQLVVPQELTLDDDGNILVTDTGYPDRILVFNPEGKLLDQVGQDSPERLVSVGPVAVGADRRVFLGESVMDRIRVFDSADVDRGFFPLPNPIDIDVLGDTMVVGSTSGFAIVDVATGQPRRVVGTRGKGETEFDTVNGVKIGADGTIYVVDSFNNRLSAYDAEGDRKWMVVTGAPGNEVDLTGGGAMAASNETTAPARLQLPADITIDGRGRLVVVDSLDFSVSVFSPTDGRFVAKYGAYGRQDGQFNYPSSIDYDPERDWFVVSDPGNNRVQIIRLPDSGAAFDPAAAARRALSGPLRACLVPLLLLLVLLILFILRSRKRRKDERLLQDEAGAATAPGSVEEPQV